LHPVVALAIARKTPEGMDRRQVRVGPDLDRAVIIAGQQGTVMRLPDDGVDVDAAVGERPPQADLAAADRVRRRSNRRKGVNPGDGRGA
jgi:hypothetical protein